MLEVFKEADLFSKLLSMYALFPYNDMALRYVTSILSFALDHKLAKEMCEKQRPAKRQSRFIDLEPIKPAESEKPAEATEPIE